MNLTDPRFQDAEKAREWLEAQRWPNGPFCPHCGNADPDTHPQAVKARRIVPASTSATSAASSSRCTVGTVFERSKVPLNKWLLATHLLTSSKKGMSAHQLHRMLGVTYKTAWFMAHRIREAMKDDSASRPAWRLRQGRRGRRTLHRQAREPASPSTQRRGRPYTKRGKSGPADKRVVIGLVERGGKTRMFHIEHATAKACAISWCSNVSRESALHTDESRLYTALAQSSTRTAPCIMRAANMPATKTTGWSRRTRSRTCSQCSVAACMASISIAAKPIFTATSMSLRSATITVRPWLERCRARRRSA